MLSPKVAVRGTTPRQTHGISEILSKDSRWFQNTGTSTACPSANNVNVRSPYFENRSQNSWNSIASGLRMFATRRNDIGMPLAIFLSSRSSRIAKALVPKYANLRSDAITAPTRAGSPGGNRRLTASSNTSEICCPRGVA
jgi:hypothetical protein